jgi:hypothetical protein
VVKRIGRSAVNWTGRGWSIWSAYPVCLGGEKNFNAFEKSFHLDKMEININYYHRLIGKAILFNEVDKIYNELKIGAYKAYVVAYIISWLSFKTNKKLNLESIWHSQTISDELREIVKRMSEIVFQHITNPSKPGMNVTDWYKKPECWWRLREKVIDMSGIENQLLTRDDFNNGDINGQLSGQELENIEQATQISSEVWLQIAGWARENQKLTAYDRRLVYNIGILIKRKYKLTPLQAKSALRIYQKALEDGFAERTT